MKNKTIVTGANGFIGTALVKELIKDGEDVVALVGRDLDASSLSGLNVEVRPFDLNDSEEQMAKALEGGNRLYHTAACYSFWRPDPDEIYMTNVRGTQRLFRSARKLSFQNTVYTSSATTLTPAWDLSSIEESEDRIFDVRNFHGHYKSSKLMAEIVALREAALGLPIVIVHPTVPIGAGDRRPTPTGEMIVHFLNRRMKAYVETCLNVADVEDVARGHILAMQKGKPGNRYILGGENLEMNQVLKILEEITGIRAPKMKIPHGTLLVLGKFSEWMSNHVTKKPPLVPIEAALHARCDMNFSSEKAQRDLGYNPRPAREALIRAVAWFVKNKYISKVDPVLAEKTAH